MTRLKSLYRCQSCGCASPKWSGQCPECGEWNTYAEEAVEAVAVRRAAAASARGLTEFSSAVVPIAEAKGAEAERLPTGLGELDRLLGGGLVPGQVVLLAGPPGIGKSTLALQAAERLASADRKVLYVSGEESLEQISGRAKRLGARAQGLYVVSETNLGRVLEAMDRLKPGVLVLDSVQTVYHPDLAGSPGSVGQVRECAAELLRAAKAKGSIILLLGHVTKEGVLAGPRILEHIVDTVLYFDTEKHDLLRVLRVHKNRFGPSCEIGLFEMDSAGLKEVQDASAYFLSESGAAGQAGRAASVAVEGSRALLAEVQALVVSTKYPLPRRLATGLDLNRILMLVAALEKHLRLRLESKDVFVTLSGGMRQRDPALDLAACLAIVSSARDAALPPDAVFLGEVGLLGQVSRVAFLSQRLKEAARLGFKRAVVPAASVKDLRVPGIKVSGVGSVSDCVRSFFEDS